MLNSRSLSRSSTFSGPSRLESWILNMLPRNRSAQCQKVSLCLISSISLCCLANVSSARHGSLDASLELVSPLDANNPESPPKRPEDTVGRALIGRSWLFGTRMRLSVASMFSHRLLFPSSSSSTMPMSLAATCTELFAGLEREEGVGRVSFACFCSPQRLIVGRRLDVLLICHLSRQQRSLLRICACQFNLRISWLAHRLKFP